MQEETLVKVTGQRQRPTKRQILNWKFIEEFPIAYYHTSKAPV